MQIFHLQTISLPPFWVVFQKTTQKGNEYFNLQVSFMKAIALTYLKLLLDF